MRRSPEFEPSIATKLHRNFRVQRAGLGSQLRAERFCVVHSVPGPTAVAVLLLRSSSQHTVLIRSGVSTPAVSKDFQALWTSYLSTFRPHSGLCNLHAFCPHSFPVHWDITTLLFIPILSSVARSISLIPESPKFLIF